MDKYERIKAVIIAVWGVVASTFGVLAIPVILLVLCNVIDYVTGLLASKYRNQVIDSYKGMRGITKKVCMWLLVAVGAMIDELLAYTSSNVGIALPFTFLLACVVAVWLVCNEIISILENINDIGVTLPPFLMPVVKHLKSQVEDKTDALASKDDADEEGGDRDD